MGLTEREKWLMLQAIYAAEGCSSKAKVWVNENESRLAQEAPIDNLLGRYKCAEREVQQYRIALEEIERHRGSTFWPQNETVESMAESAKEVLERMGAWD